MTVLLVDANNVAMRSIHAMARSGLSAHGVSTGPLLAFVNTLSKHIREEQPDRVAVCWDGGRSEHRVALDEQYKAHRLSMDPQDEENKHSVFALAKEFCSLAGLHHVERPGVEADDLIAYHWRTHRPLDEKVVILSSDKDFLQLLIEGQVEQVRLSSSGTPTDRWTADRVRTEMGCDPKHLPYAMALAGDDADNVPGVPRFGMKTAVKTLAKYEFNLDTALRNDHRLVDHVDRVRLNLSLVDLRESVMGQHLPALPLFRPTAPGDVTYPLLLSFLTQHQMKSVQSRLYEQALWK
jgi:DNA polymerase I